MTAMLHMNKLTDNCTIKMKNYEPVFDNCKGEVISFN